MVPIRKKGASKAAAVIAACRQWKVGDLVLAKVKGFPAWPARVGEPQKWNFQIDRKKVFVCFFGTQQVAFCNPADVEAFTEEKGKSLLVKRHGKGADFVQAVCEIVDSFNKLNNQDQDTNNVHSSDDVTVTNPSNSVESFADSEVKDEVADIAKGKTFSESTDSTKVKYDVDIPIEEYASETQNYSLHDSETPSEDPSGNMVATDTPRPTTYSRNKRRVIQAQNFDARKKVPSAPRSKSSSRADSYNFHNNKIVENVPVYGLRDVSTRRSKRVRKSPSLSEANDVGSPAFTSNGSVEENGSESFTVDSDGSFNVGSTVEFAYGLSQPESMVECSDEAAYLGQRLDFQANGVIVKKKRKPSRKRASNGTTESISGLDKKIDSAIEVHKSEENSRNDFGNLNEKYLREDGDEHLPLVKRARVRMGSRPSSGAVEPDSSVQVEGISSEILDSRLRRVCESMNSEEVVMVDLDNSSSLNKCHVSKPPSWGIKKKFDRSVDGEAALPPSKRLQRALRVMSANVAEAEGQSDSEEPSSMKTLMNASCFPMKDYSSTSFENRSEGEIKLDNIDSPSKNASQDCNTPLKSNDIPEVAVYDCVTLQGDDCADCRSPGVSSLGAHIAQTEAPSPKSPSPVTGREQSIPGNEQDSEGLMLCTTDDSKTENYELKKACADHDPTISSTQSDNTIVVPCDLQNNCESTNLLKLAIEDNNQDNGMCMEKEEPAMEDSKSIPSPPTDSKSVPSPPTEQTTTTAVQDPHLSQLTSIIEDDLRHKNVIVTRSSSSPTDRLESTAGGPPTDSSTFNMRISDNSKFIANNNSCCSHEVRLPPHEKPKHGGKSSSRLEAKAALQSFEISLRSLTRTKDCIARATHIAIDCAKFGVGAKVVEILVESLESEPRVYRRVDLFLLVDSITQYSRGLKGVSGMYPSSIQAMLSRILLAAAPPGSNAWENRRQCLKILRRWQERRVFPESIIRPHIQDLDPFCNSAPAGPFCHRFLRRDRVFDDPLREVEGMVDEYGSNSRFQLPGFRMPAMHKTGYEGECDSDGEGFEAVTPERNNDNNSQENLEGVKRNNPEENLVRGGKAPLMSSVNEMRRHHILKEVDGELEMEDVAPTCCEDGFTRASSGVQNKTAEISQNLPIMPFASPLPKDVPTSSPPMPKYTHLPPHSTSLTLPPPLLLQPKRPCAVPDPTTNVLDSKLYVGNHSVARGVWMPMPETANPSSFGNPTVSRPPSNSGPQLDKAFHLKPPLPATSNQFSYVQVDRQLQTQDEVPPQAYANGSRFVQNKEGGNSFNDHDRVGAAPREINETWRLSAPSLTGPCYPDSSNMSYTPDPFVGPLVPDHSWAFPPRPMYPGEIFHHRPPLGGPIPVADRAPNFWHPR